MEPSHFHRGFSLVEIFVVLVIIVTLALIVITSQTSFNKSFILSNAANDIALTLRSAQSFGLANRVTGGGAANAAYGVRFTKSSTLTSFADIYTTASCTTPDCKPGNHVYDASQNETVQTYTLNNGISVKDLCAYASSWTCGLTSLDISFARPNPDVYFATNGVYSTINPISKVCIKVAALQGGAQYVYVYASGLIAANSTPCP